MMGHSEVFQVKSDCCIPIICMGEPSAVVKVSSSPGSVIAVFNVSGISLYVCK